MNRSLTPARLESRRRRRSIVPGTLLGLLMVIGFTAAGIQVRAVSTSTTAVQTSSDPAAASSLTMDAMRWLVSWSNPRAEAACMVLLGLCLLGTARLRDTAQASKLSKLTVVPARREAA
jgi:hypothetical protein